MLETKKFRTRQEIREPMTNPKGKDYIIGLDLGYSSSKTFYESGCLTFPSYAKRIDETMITGADEKDILYRDDETGEVYMVGYNAQNIIDETDTNDTESELFSRKRYTNQRFRILCDTSLGLALRNKKDGRKVIIQTGLPTSYVRGDSAALRQALSRNAHFSLKIGTEGWRSFAPEISANDIYVMPQPAGGLYSALIRNDGTYIPDAKKILSDSVLVMDIGFGTFDFYGIRNRTLVCTDTVSETAMRAVMSDVSKRILEEYGEDIRVAALQTSLANGTIECFNDEKMMSETKPLAPILEEANAEIRKQAFEKARGITKGFRGYHYVIVTGGTGAAWYKDIEEWLKGMKTLRLMPSNLNDRLPLIYSPSRGYYMFRRSQNIRK